MRRLLPLLLLVASACGPEPAAAPERRLLTGLEAEEFTVTHAANRLAHPRFTPRSRPVDWMAWTVVRGAAGEPERLFLPDQPYPGPTLEAHGPGVPEPWWVSALAAGGPAPLRVSLWVGLPEGERLWRSEDGLLEEGTHVLLQGFEPAEGVERAFFLGAEEVAEGPVSTPEGFDWYRVEASLDHGTLGQLELRVHTTLPVLRLGRPLILGGPRREALADLAPAARSRLATPGDLERARLRQADRRSRPPPDARPEAHAGALDRRRALRAMQHQAR
ncbi:MAG: hypothetical protein P1V51_24460 [Deltaproteobacteria bacterium]|nr:hypothetical protein [Deltaproteobacteria bacterium]